MGSRLGSALCAVLACAAIAPPRAAAAGFEGMWVGGFRGRSDWVFLRVTLAGEHTAATGRADLPLSGVHGVLLHDVRFRDGRVSFVMPAADGGMSFDGKLDGNTIRGSIRQGPATGTFELMRHARLPTERVAPLLGNYQLAPDRTILLYDGPQGLAYVDYGTGRAGQLFALDENTFVSGPSVLAAYPVDLRARVERDSRGTITGLSWEARGQPPARGRRTPIYRTEDVAFVSGEVTLGASLLLPPGPGPFPAVVMSHGSGPVPRGALMPVADVLARNGVAVLVPDKRGVGSSGGDWARATFDDLAGDTLAGVAFLAGRPEIDASRIGLQGASLGGWVAPLAASRSRDVAFVIVEAAPVTTPAEHERDRVQNQMRADGFPRESIAQALAFMAKKAEVGRTARGWERLVHIMEKGRSEGWLGYTNPPSSLESLTWHWRHIMSYDPLPALESLHCPVLAIYGGLDTIVSAGVSLKRLRKALARAGNRDVTITVYPRANHNFFAAISGGPAETARLQGFVPGYLAERVEWLRARVEPGGPPAPRVIAAARIPGPRVPPAGPFEPAHP